MVYLFGGFGCKNVGDDVLLSVASKRYPGSTPVYVDFPIQGGISTNLAIEILHHTDTIVFAGGIPFNSLAADHITNVLCEICDNIHFVSISHYDSEFTPSALKCFKKSKFLSTRDSITFDFFKQNGLDHAILEPDLAYYLSNSIPKKNYIKKKEPIIGITISRKKYLPLFEQAIKQNLSLARFVLISHTDHPNNTEEDDNSTMNTLFENLNSNRVQYIPYGTISNTLNVYNQIDALIGTRLHSFIFADFFGIPILGFTDLEKLRWFFQKQHRQMVNFDISEFSNFVKSVSI